MDFSKVKKFCSQEIARNTEVCLDPLTEEKDRVIAAAEARAYRTVLELDTYTSWDKFKEDF